jgi:hypothetical protein
VPTSTPSHQYRTENVDRNATLRPFQIAANVPAITPITAPPTCAIHFVSATERRNATFTPTEIPHPLLLLALNPVLPFKIPSVNRIAGHIVDVATHVVGSSCKSTVVRVVRGVASWQRLRRLAQECCARCFAGGRGREILTTRVDTGGLHETVGGVVGSRHRSVIGPGHRSWRAGGAVVGGLRGRKVVDRTQARRRDIAGTATGRRHVERDECTNRNRASTWMPAKQVQVQSGLGSSVISTSESKIDSIMSPCSFGEFGSSESNPLSKSSEPVKLRETPIFQMFCSASSVSGGRLIHAAVGSSAGFGIPFTKRSGCAA